jgi:hypothetical protein
MTILGQMDRVVYATGLDRIIFMKFQPRSFRWTPLLLIAVLVAGYALMANAQGPVRPGGLMGWMLFYGAFLAAGLVRVFGPRFRPTFTHPLDERELTVRSRAYALSGILLAGVAMLGCFYMGGADLLRLWRPHTPNDWVSLGFGFQAGGWLLPTLIASWLEPRPADDE